MTLLNKLFYQLDATLERWPVLKTRLDGAFFREHMIDVLEAEGV